LADIISLIKNADSEQNPLLTAEERVTRVIEAILKKHKFTNEQKEWLGYIKEHLIVNLAIEKENFDFVPVLERHGGLTKVQKLFSENLNQIIDEINYKLAA
jgi:type I restriction enzyme R subunit